MASLGGFELIWNLLVFYIALNVHLFVKQKV